eukprot:2312072-Amphidinium_carterae.1
MYDCGAAVSVAPLSFAPHVNLLPLNGDQKLQTVTDDEIKVHGIKQCTVITGGIGLKVSFIVSNVSCPIKGNSTIEENSCFAIVTPPPFKSWIRDLSSNAGSRMVKIGRHYYIHGLVIEGHATSVTVNRQKVKEHICQSDWRGLCVTTYTSSITTGTIKG